MSFKTFYCVLLLFCILFTVTKVSHQELCEELINCGKNVNALTEFIKAKNNKLTEEQITLVKRGSCLEYGHSCWGAHGKRSENSHHVDFKPATEVDFADINAIKESPYDSSEDHLRNTNDKIPENPEMPKPEDETNLENVSNVLKLKNILLKQLNKTGKRRVQEASAADNDAARRTSAVDAFVNGDRWRRLPIWNLKRYQLNKDNWLNNLEREQQQPRLIDDTEDYI